MRYYLVSITTTSSGTEDRKLTPYDDYDTAIRKFHEAFNNVGAGPKKVLVLLIDENGFNIKQEMWTAKVEEPEVAPEE